MEDGKPSKEQLDSYYRTSRKYFDELAKQYFLNDREFYDKNFAPYYSNPLTRVRGTGGIKIFIYVTAFFMTSMAVLAFVVLSQRGVTFEDVFNFKDEPDETEVMYTTETTTERKVITNPVPDGKFDTLAVSYLKSDFEKGAYYYGRKNYEMAEYHFNRIEKKDNDYVPAQEVLKRIQKEKTSRDTRAKPIEKIN